MRDPKKRAFPAACVKPEEGNDYTLPPAKNTSTEELPEKPIGANISKQIQERKASQFADKQGSRNNSKRSITSDVNKLRRTKPEKTFQIKMVKNPEKEEDRDARAKDIFSKSSMATGVRFNDIKIEHSISVPESISSWQDSSFEDSFRDQPANYDNYFSDRTQDKKNTITKKEKSEGSYHRFGKVSSFKSSTENFLKSPKEKKRGIKAVIGIISGIIIGSFMFLVYHHSFGYTVAEAGILMAILTVLFCVGMALSSFIRCIMALVVPNFFTGIGRGILLSAIFALILRYPVSNISLNARETGSSMACIVELAANQTRILQRQLAVPLQDISEYVKRQKKDLKSITNEWHSKFEKVKDILDRFGTLCENVDFPVTCNEIVLGVNFHDVSRKTRAAFEEAINYFDTDIVINADFSGNVNVSKPATAIQAEVEQDIGGKLDAFDSAISVVGKCLSLSLFLIFLQSFWYLRNYLANDGYDNIYITKQFRELDRKAEKNGKETVLPLKKHETNEYVNTLSFKLNSTELAYSQLGLIQVSLHLLLSFLVITFDYALYYILNIVKEYGDIELDVESRNHLKIEVQGSGPVADFYKLIVQGYNLDRSFNLTLDIDTCLPEPREPSAAMIPVFIILYLIAIAVVLLRAYGMRLRRKVSAYYCPEQELARLDYLHKKMRHKRVGFLNFLRQQIKSAHKEEQVKNKLRFSSWLAFNFPFFAQILPQKAKLECTSCGQKETSFSDIKLTKCTGTKGGVQCDAVYCRECYTTLLNICPLCSSDDTVVLRE